MNAAHQQEILPGGEVGGHGGLLRGHADAVLDGGGIGDHAAAQQAGVTAVGPGQAGQHFDGGGLSGAVDPQQGEQLPLPDRQVQAVHGSDGPVALGQALYFDGVHFCASFSLNRANTPMYTSVSDALISSVSQSRKDVAAMEAMPWT